MPSIKPVIKNDHVNADGKCNIKIRISHKRAVRYIATPYYIQPDQMNGSGQVVDHPSQAKLNSSLLAIMKGYTDKVAEMDDIDYRDINSLVASLRIQEQVNGDFIKYARSRIKQLELLDKFSLADSYKLTVNHLTSYKKSDEILFSSINVFFLQNLEMHLRFKKLKPNSISVYMRNIRAIYNDAIDQDVVKAELYPFRKYKIPSEETKKRALSLYQVKLLLMGPHPRVEQRAVDLFMLSFYLLGINFKDLLFAQWADVEKGRLIYRRAKTSRIYSIKIQQEAMDIINRYRGDMYLINIMEKKALITPENRSTPPYKDITRETNKLLKRVFKWYGKDLPVSSYWARHTWATIAAEIGVPRDVIAHALGHNINTVTDIYIDFDLSKVDKANREVIDYIKN